MLNWAVRYGVVLDELRRLEPELVLDVGSGVHGVTRYWPGKAVQTDLGFETNPWSSTRLGAAQFVQASAEHLPFADSSFDVVVSLDLMEHLPVDVRIVALEEMVRASRGTVIVGFPCGPGARRTDERLARWLRRLGRPQPGWLAEHLELTPPTASAFQSALPAGVQVERVLGNGNRVLHNLIMLAEETRGLRRLTAAAERLPVSPRLAGLRRSRHPYRRVWVLSLVAPAAH